MIGDEELPSGDTLSVEHSGRPPPADAESLTAGASLDRYLILGFQGRGAMGAVYSAYDQKLERKVALKLLQRDDVAGRHRQRLLREAQALAQLAHPNVVVVFDVGAVGDQLFLTMELVAGDTLRVWLQQRRSWRELRRVFVEAGRGLAAAHAAGVIHRDFKPDNVLVGHDGRARVADFGLARAFFGEGDGEGEGDDVEHAACRPAVATTVTASGSAVGTPAYMSPEQKAGARADARSDQYSFCVALFEALHGRRPDITGRSRIADRTLPPHVRRVLERGLSSAPGERYPSMDALLIDLDRDVRTRRLLAGATGLLALGALAAFGSRRDRVAQPPPCRGGESKLAGVWDASTRRAGRAAFEATRTPFAAATWRSVEQSIDRGSRAWVMEWTDACEATRVRGEQSDELLDVRMECLDTQRQELRSFVALLAHADAALVQRSPQAVESVIDVEACRRIELLRQIVKPPRDPGTRARVQAIRADLAEAEALRYAGKFADSAARARAALTAARALDYPPAVAEALYHVAVAQDSKQELAAAAAGLREAAATSEAAHDDHLRAQSLAELVRVLGLLARYEEAEGDAVLAQAAIERAGGDDDLQVRLLRARLKILQGRGRYDAALELAKQVVTLREQTADARPTLLANALLTLGEAYHLQRDQDQAIATTRRALAMYERVLGSTHPSTALAAGNIGAAYFEKSEPAEALPYAQRALAIREASLGPDNLDVARSAQLLGLVLADLGQLDRAHALLQRAATITEKSLGPTHPEVAECWFSIANLLLLRGAAAEALQLARRGLSIREHRLAADHPDLAFSLDQVAQAELALGHASAALPLSERAVSIIEGRKPMRTELAELRVNLARALWASAGDRVRARRLMIAARDVFAAEGQPLHKDLLDAEAWLGGHGGPAPVYGDPATAAPVP